MTKAHKDSRLWQNAMQLAADVYALTASLPAAERLGLSNQLQRAAVAIPTHIATGSGSRGQLLEACQAAQTSAAELETLLLLTGQIYPDAPAQAALDQLEEIHGLLAALAQRLSTPAQSRKTL